MPQQSPDDYTKEVIGGKAKEFANALVDGLRQWTTVKSAVTVIGGAIALVAGAIWVFPFVVSGVLGVVLIYLAVNNVAAHNLLYRERRLRAWDEIDARRIEQREIRAQIAIREATLVAAGQRGSGNAGMRVYPPLNAAINYREAQYRQAVQGDVSPRQRLRNPAKPKAPDVSKTQRELEKLRARDEAVEAKIQALAAPDAKREADAEEKTKAWQRVKTADSEARDRARRGIRPTTPTSEIGFEISRNADGSRKVDKAEPRQTPEQIARGEEEKAD